MEILRYLIYPLGAVLEVVAIIHFIRRRPDNYWLFIILFLGPMGSLIYLCVEALPEIQFFREISRGGPRRKRIAELEGMILDNPSCGNYEELGDLYLDDGNFAVARATFDKAIAARSDSDDCFYHRALCSLQLSDAPAAVCDLERVVARDAGHDFHRAAGLLAFAYAQAGQKEKAEQQFQKAIAASTLSETYLNFAEMLVAEGRLADARQCIQRVLNKERTMPAYLRRRERPWFEKANEMMRRLSADSATAP